MKKSKTTIYDRATMHTLLEGEEYTLKGVYIDEGKTEVIVINSQGNEVKMPESTYLNFVVK